MVASEDIVGYMPFGFIKNISGEPVIYDKAKEQLQHLIPIRDLSFKQKKRLVMDCWNEGFWNDVVIGKVRVKRYDAIEAVEKLEEFKSELKLKTTEQRLGKTLLEMTLLGYERMYEKWLPMDIIKYPLPKIELPVVDMEKTLKKAEVKTFTIIPHLKIPIVSIYKIVNNAEHLQLKVTSDEKKQTADFFGQKWLAKDENSNTISSFRVLPGKSWNLNFENLPPDQFLPSLKPNKKNQKKSKVQVTATNHLKTYVNLFMVRSTGQLHYLHMILPQATVTMKECYVGYSFVAVQGGTVFSDFQVLASNYTEWSIGKSIGKKGMKKYEKIFKTGENNYIYYHVKTEQDDTIKPKVQVFKQDIEIAEGTNFLNGILSQSNSTCFQVPEGKYEVSVIDPKKKKYLFPKNEATLDITDPIPGKWRVKVKVQTNTPIFFQLQTLPTKDKYATIRKTFEGNSHGAGNSQWKEFVCRALAGMIIDEQKQPWDDVVHDILKKGNSLIKKGYNWKIINQIKHLVNSLSNTDAPVPKDLPHILLVDANGEDELTRNLYSARDEYLYKYVKENSKYKENVFTLSQVNKVDFQKNLQNQSIRLVSFGGHGGIEELYGHSRLNGQNLEHSPILTSQEVNENQDLVKDKIFHAFACNTCIEDTERNVLGRAIVDVGKAIAYIGYNGRVRGVIAEDIDRSSNFSYQLQYEPDCKIVQALIEGKTVAEAVVLGKQEYEKLASKHNYTPTKNGLVQANGNLLGYYGNKNAKL